MNDTETNTVAWVRVALEHYEGPLIRYAARIMGDPEQARDVVQDTFLRLCKVKRRQVEDHLAPWLFKVCRNRALDLRRKERHMRPLTATQAEAYPSSQPSPSDVAASQEAQGRVCQILARLPKNQQEVVHLKFQDGMSYKEISSITGLSVSNVGFLLHTAIKTIRQHLQAEDTSAQEA